MGEVIEFNAFLAKKTNNAMLKRVEDYQAIIDEMSKLELLEEMVRYQEYRTKNYPNFSEEMLLRGLILFKSLCVTAETKELYSLTIAMHDKLSQELNEMRAKKSSGPEAS